MALRWRGSEVKRRVRAAERQGIDETMAAAAIHAKRNHTWKNRTGTLEGSIGTHQPARDTVTGASGVWGSQDVVYALIHELGGQFIPPRPYLRPAAAVEYPNLARRIKTALAGLPGVAAE